MSVNQADVAAPGEWSTLSKSQMGRYAEYVVKMELSRLGCDVYVPEVDDKGIDLLVRLAPGRYAEVQVKSVRGSRYVFMRKAAFPLDESRYLALVVFGWDAPGRPPLSLGYVNIPAVLVMGLLTTAIAPFGARLAHRLDRRVLRRAFAVFLLLTAISIALKAI